jgi:uncharacterized caspase-like protein
MLAAQPAAAEVRALVWALDYSTSANRDLRLENTLVDARAVAALLDGIGVRDLKLVENPTPDAWDREIQNLVARLQPQDVALLYYAGHALQVGGGNYFLAADGTTLISSEDVLSTIVTRAHGTIFLIDACRNNPFRKSAQEPGRSLTIRGGPQVGAPDGTTPNARSRSLTTVPLAEIGRAASGLSQMGNLRGKNTIVLFSTDPGNVALDGDPGQGSPFANAVISELAKRQSLDSAIRRITDQVDKRTGSRQSPWRQGDLGFTVYLAGQPRFPVP